MTDKEIRDMRYELASYKGTVRTIRDIINIEADEGCERMHRSSQFAMINALVNREVVGGKRE